MGYAGRKPCTGNRDVRFGEEAEDGMPLLYSTLLKAIGVSCSYKAIDNSNTPKMLKL
jgi:hypothetical protein